MGNDNKGRQMAHEEELDLETRLDLLQIELDEIGEILAALDKKMKAVATIFTEEGN